MSNWTPRLRAHAGTLSIVCLLAGPLPATAATFPADDAAGLIAAISSANATPEEDVVELTDDVTLSAVHDATNGPNGTPPIVTPIVIRGHGFTIARAADAPEFRLLQVRGAFFGDGALTLDGVGLAGGDLSTVPTDCFLDLDGCGAALLSLFGQVTVRNGTRFTGNAAFGGGAFYNAGGNATMRDVTFSANVAGRGGAIFNTGGLIGDPATVALESARFEANEAVNEGGAISNQAELEVADSVFTLNRVTGTPAFGGGGGGIYNSTFNGQVRVVASTFTENEAVRGGALSNYNASDVELENCLVRDNQNVGLGGGGGIWSDNNTSLTVRNSQIVENRAPGVFSKGGGIYSGQNNALGLEGSLVADNVASDDGGGIFMDSVNAAVASSITNSRIDSNEAGGDGGGIYKNGGSPVTIAASSISDNLANGQNGGGIAVEALSGGGVPPIGVVIRDSTIARNRLVTGDGGGVSNENQGRVTIERSTIADNEVTGVGGVIGNGAGVFSNNTNSTVSIADTTISGNDAQSVGGGTYNNNASIMSLVHVTVTGNTAGLQGGGVVAFATTSIQGSIVAGNQANHPTQPQQHNCSPFSVTFTDLGGNFTDDANGICPAGFTVSPAIALGPLADNGGPTATHALGTGSVAIDAVPGCGLATDQRGVPRDALCDAGAFEGDVVVPRVGFDVASSTVSEAAGAPHEVAVVLDNRAGTIASASAEVHVAIVGTTAAGHDYDVAVSPPLVFAGPAWPAPGTGTSLAVSFDLLPDFRVEPAETIRLELRDGGIVGPADLGTIDVHTVTVVDACPPAPDPLCKATFEKGVLKIDEREVGKEKLIVQLKKGPALAQPDLGDPLDPDGTAYRLCLYDDQALPVGSLAVDRAGAVCGGKPCWKALGGSPPAGKGFLYKDKALAADGIKLLKMKGGKPGKSLLAAKAGNQAATLPTGIAGGLAASAGGATVQLLTSNADCFSRTFTEVGRREPDRFQAK